MNIKYLDKESLEIKIKNLNDVYWNHTWEGRWEYMSIVIEEIKKIQPKTILELGAYKINLTNISDNMDLELKFIDKDNIKNKKYVQDAIKLPWNISDKYYDIFIGLQVFEHLPIGTQNKVFKEVVRVSKNAILSFPYMWDIPTNISHHMIDEEIIKKWINNIKPNTVKYINVPIVRKRVIYMFNFK